MDLGISDKVKPILEEVKHFIDTEILPLEHEYHGEVSKGDRWTFTERQTEIHGIPQGEGQGQRICGISSSPILKGAMASTPLSTPTLHRRPAALTVGAGGV